MRNPALLPAAGTDWAFGPGRQKQLCNAPECSRAPVDAWKTKKSSLPGVRATHSHFLIGSLHLCLLRNPHPTTNCHLRWRAPWVKDSSDLILKCGNSYLGRYSQLAVAAACVVRHRLLSEYFACVKSVSVTLWVRTTTSICAALAKRGSHKITIENIPPLSSLLTGCVTPRHSLLLLWLPLLVLPTLLPSPPAGLI